MRYRCAVVYYFVDSLLLWNTHRTVSHSVFVRAHWVRSNGCNCVRIECNNFDCNLMGLTLRPLNSLSLALFFVHSPRCKELESMMLSFEHMCNVCPLIIMRYAPRTIDDKETKVTLRILLHSVAVLSNGTAIGDDVAVNNVFSSDQQPPAESNGKRARITYSLLRMRLLCSLFVPLVPLCFDC